MSAIVQGGIAGLLNGSLYALIGVSITLMFRSTGVLSFAHAAFAMLAAYVYSSLTAGGWPVAVAALVAIAITVLVAVVVERIAVRPVAESAPVTRLIVTLGILFTIQGVILAIFGFDPRSAPQLLPPRSVDILGVLVLYQQIAIFVLTLGLALGLGAILRRTRIGLAVQAAAQDITVARLLGARPATIAAFNWGLAGLLSAIAGVFAAPLLGVTGATFPILLVKSLAGTLFGGLVSIPATFVGGLFVGVAESIAVILSGAPGIREMTVLGVVVALLLLRRSWPAEFVEEGTVERLRQPTSELAGRIGTAVFGTAVLVFLALAVFSKFWAFMVALGAVFAMAALALVILTGWSGQPSLMHASFMGLGAFATFVFIARYGVTPPLAVLLGALAGMALGGLVALPALRLRGLQLAVVTLAVAGAVAQWLVQLRTINLILRRPTVLGLDLSSDQVMAAIIVPIAGLVFLGAHQLRRSSWGALLLATRHRQEAVPQFGVSPVRVKIMTFLISGFIAALAGSLWGILVTRFGSAEVGINASIRLLLIVVIGGIMSLWGPLIAVFYFTIIPQFIPSYSVATAIPDIVLGLVVVFTLASYPGGVASALRPLRLPFRVRRPGDRPGRIGPGEASRPAPSRPTAREREVTGASS